MDRFGVVGVTHHRASSEEIGWFSEAPGSLEEYRLALGVDEILHLRTCNRVETYWVSHEHCSPDRVLRAFGTWFEQKGSLANPQEPLADLVDSVGFALSGDATHRHLSAMLCGLDSKVLGDEQVVGQFRSALFEAREQDVCKHWLGMLGDETVKLSRRVRKQVDYTHLPTSVAGVAANILRKKVSTKPARITLLGSGEMVREIGQRLAGWLQVSLCFVNRTQATAQELAEKHGGVSQSLSDFQACPQDFDHLVTATGSFAPLVFAKALAQLPKQEEERLILDLGVPADTEASIRELPGFKRYDVLEVSSEAETNQVAGRVLQRTIRPYLREGGLHFREKIFRRNLNPVADKLRQSIEERAKSEASRWAKTKLAHLDPEDLALFEEFALRLADLTVQVPLVALRNTLRELPMGDLILGRLRQAGRLAAQEERDKAANPLND
ncbi:MAG: hypothetical protein O3A95_05340 [Planctomycetota bacterium]|nr:hypothetical protein [Planctomycetota bacterium]